MPALEPQKTVISNRSNGSWYISAITSPLQGDTDFLRMLAGNTGGFTAVCPNPSLGTGLRSINHAASRGWQPIIQ